MNQERSSNPEDQRRSRRIPWVEVSDLSHREFGTFTGEMRDLSPDGVRFVSARELPLDTVVQLQIKYNPIDFPIRACIVWKKEAGSGHFEYGAEFVNVPEGKKLLLKDHIQDIRKQLQP